MFESLMQVPLFQQMGQLMQGNADAFNRGVGVALFIWVIAILRTMKDITARTHSIGVQILCILLVGSLTPII